MTDLKSILEKIHTILLVDWPNRDVPRSLAQAGFTVFSYSPGTYSQALIETTLPASMEDGLIFRSIDHAPDAVDLVMIYRPPEEHAAIIRDQVLPLGAKLIWLQPPVESPKTKEIADEHGLNFVQGHDIREIIHNR
jgi:predicted CoA-binding protein